LSTLFDAGVVVDADASEQGQLFSAQTRYAAAATIDETDICRIDEPSSDLKVLAQPVGTPVLRH
jgi:hypothetical protein